MAPPTRKVAIACLRPVGIPQTCWSSSASAKAHLSHVTITIRAKEGRSTTVSLSWLNQNAKVR